MKCPHCNTSIPGDSFGTVNVWNTAEVQSRQGKFLDHAAQWSASVQRCPECHDQIIFLKRAYTPHVENPGTGGAKVIPHAQPTLEFMAYPRSSSRIIPQEVTGPYREDFSEACKVLADSPKASAALSRRCLQAILKDKAGAKKKDLNDQIDEVVASKQLPSYIEDDLHAVRNIGNFAAHTMKSTATGMILDVEPGEAEWNLDVLESLFDFYFVAPAADAKRKATLNAKLKAAGKPELP